ncbi:C40 family peptidase [Clostridium sp. KNHs205]|uniref:C40 family peptidase n=1 Tax=Clostridium sp. KNHs205 TaxID=1449050 RepID=UPI00068F383E|nr:C40 family peptidase [Clostridium sp. KNHs205]
MNHRTTKFIKISCVCIAGTFLFALNAKYTSAETVYGEQPLAGISVTLDNYYNSGNMAASSEITIATWESSVAAYDYSNLGIADVENHLNIRKDAGEDQKIIAKLPKNAGCTIINEDKDGWVKIKSGKVTGYVKKEFLITGDKAAALAKKVGSLVATVNTPTLNVRSEASLLAGVVTSVPIDEELEVTSVTTDWVKVKIDADEGYVARQYIDLSYQLEKAVSVDELAAGVSGIRAQMVAYAKQFLGNPYVWGGTSLTNGTDCSGFTMGIYAKYGYYLPRVSRSQAYSGTSVNSSNLKPGDLVFYGSGSYINHVAMYIGNGQVIHASNPRTGIKISNMYYRSPIRMVRIIND